MRTVLFLGHLAHMGLVYTPHTHHHPSPINWHTPKSDTHLTVTHPWNENKKKEKKKKVMILVAPLNLRVIDEGLRVCDGVDILHTPRSS